MIVGFKDILTIQDGQVFYQVSTSCSTHVVAMYLLVGSLRSLFL